MDEKAAPAGFGAFRGRLRAPVEAAVAGKPGLGGSAAGLAPRIQAIWWWSWDQSLWLAAAVARRWTSWPRREDRGHRVHTVRDRWAGIGGRGADVDGAGHRVPRGRGAGGPVPGMASFGAGPAFLLSACGTVARPRASTPLSRTGPGAMALGFHTGGWPGFCPGPPALLGEKSPYSTRENENAFLRDDPIRNGVIERGVLGIHEGWFTRQLFGHET